MKILFYFMLFLIPLSGYPCTIGIIRADLTQSGKPIIWKTRDRDSGFGINYPVYDDVGLYPFTGFNDSVNLNSTWGGINTVGFGIANSLASDLAGTSSTFNGALIRVALRNYESLNEFEEYLDATNQTGRNTKGNFAAFDRFGNGAMYEIANNEWYKFDLSDAENGFIVRTNFSFNGEPNPESGRYIRSNTIINELIENNIFDVKNLIDMHFRDFSDFEGNPFDIPYQGSTNGYYGYINNRYSICRHTSIGSFILEGIDEDNTIPIMWTLAGFPGVTPVIPYIPYEFYIDQERIPNLALSLKSNLMNINSYLINTIHFLHPDNQGIWDKIRPFETNVIYDFQEIYSSADFLGYYQGWLVSTESMAFDLMSTIVGSTDITLPPIPKNIIATFPNPNTHSFYIKSDYVFKSEYTIEVYNIKGQLLHNVTHDKEKKLSDNAIYLDENLPSGIYLIRVMDSENTFTTKTLRLK